LHAGPWDGCALFGLVVQRPIGSSGLLLRERVESYFKGANIPIVVRYFDPSYLIRSSPANAADAILCDLYARNAVHAAMAGKTGLVIGFLHDVFIHIPIEMPAGICWNLSSLYL
jgi:6-phosphofructokinase